MEITYKNKKIKSVCTDVKVSDRTYGKEMSGKIQQRINEISAADSIDMMIMCRIGRCHPLTNNRKGQFAVDLVHPYRLVFERRENVVEIAHVLEIVDYH